MSSNRSDGDRRADQASGRGRASIGPEGEWPKDIDGTAPVISRHSITIAAPVNRIWEIHTDVAAWPSWQEDITTVRIDGSLSIGKSFTWETSGIDAEITSEVYALEPASRTLWGGMVTGIMGVHEWRFEAQKSQTIVRTAESWSGQPVAESPAELQHALDESLERWLKFLMNRAEE